MGFTLLLIRVTVQPALSNTGPTLSYPSRLSLSPPEFLPDVLSDPTDLIWRKGTPFEAMTGRTAASSDSLLAEVFWGFPRL